MKEAQQKPINRCFGGHCPKDPNREREEALKAAFRKVAEEKRKSQAARRAHEEINSCLRLSKGSLIKILPLVINRVADKRYPRLVLEVLLERIRRNQWNKLSPEDKCLVIQAEASLGNQPE